jgi:hypothetical protein
MVMKFQFSIVLTLFLLITIVVLYQLQQLKGVTNFAVSNNHSVSTSAHNNTWLREFKEHELHIYSQNGEDGILLWIFANIGTVNKPPFYVEFGAGDGGECNTHFLRDHLGWRGLMMDNSNENHNLNLHREMINASNINELLEKYHTPSTLDLLSIDVDFDDYFVWKSILQKNRFRARVVVIEYNCKIPPNENRVVDPYQDTRRMIGTMHFGAGILALAALGRAYGYTLVYSDQNGVNLFFIETAILQQQRVLETVVALETLHALVPTHRCGHKPEPDKSRKWIWNDTKW